MNKTLKRILTLTILISAAAALVILTLFLNHIPENEAALAGNTGGNLYNGGLFCEADGKVYFANSYDYGSLYSMNVDETGIKKLLSSNAYSINTDGRFLYYCQSAAASGSGLGYLRSADGLYRCRANGNSAVLLEGSSVIAASLCGNDLYYLKRDPGKDVTFLSPDPNSLFKMGIDGNEEMRVLDYHADPSSFVNGRIYFTGSGTDHYLRELDVATGAVTDVLQINVYHPVYDDGYLYFMDTEQNYRLCRYSLSGNQTEILTADRVDTYNIKDGIIFYQKNSSDDPALIRMNSDGSNPETVAAGNYTKINMTSIHAYYQEFGDAVTTYRTPLFGTPEMSVFAGALEAVSD